jgi:hypothetical protein
MKLSMFPKITSSLAALAASLSLAQAATLAPGGVIGMSLEVEPVGASPLATTNVSFSGINFANQVLISGNLVSSVWANDASSGLGGYTFTYQLFSSSSSLNSIDRLTLNSFSGFQTDVGYNGAGIVPIRASRPSNALIAFVFETIVGLPTLEPGMNSPILVIQTDASIWGVGNASIIDGATANIATFVPLGVVIPEPTTAAFVVLGFAALSLRRKR